MVSPLGLIQQMNSRERRIIGFVLVLLFLGGVGFYYVRLLGEIDEVETALLDGEEAVSEIRARSQDYRDSMRRKGALEEAIKENDQRIQTAIDSMARKIELTGAPNGQTATGTLNSVLRYDAKTTERPILLGDVDKKQRKTQLKKTEFFELSQPVEYSFVRFLDMVKFLEDVESPERLMYVSKLQVTRKYMDPEYVQGRLTISTFIYKAQAEPEPKEE